MTSRRDTVRVLTALAAASAAPRLTAQAFPGTPHHYPGADPAYSLSFPRDFGAHNEFRTEWWYLTGWLDGDRQGFQITFFRVRTAHPDGNPSRFAPRQLLFAHAAVMRPEIRHALHGQRSARLGSPGTVCSDSDTDVRIGDWRLTRQDDDRYHTTIRDQAFNLQLLLVPPGRPGDRVRQPWLQGDHGFSRKGPQPDQASHYYSRPHLEVSGTVDGKATRGVAWCDHEWSTTVLDPAAAGWDWTGINLDDGSALVAFRIRRRSTSSTSSGATEPLWKYCALRYPDGRSEQVSAIRFQVLRTWQSPRTSAIYPVSMELRLPGRTLRLDPLFDDQELDSRASTGTIYWEGAVRVFDGNDAEAEVGRGYLELTGYDTPMRL